MGWGIAAAWLYGHGCNTPFAPLRLCVKGYSALACITDSTGAVIQNYAPTTYVDRISEVYDEIYPARA